MIKHVKAVLRDDELRRVRALLGSGQFVDGRRSASGAAAEVKNNLQLAGDHPARKELDHVVLEALARNQDFQEIALPKTIKQPLYNRYDAGMEYGFHVDAPFFNSGRLRADISFTLFLTPLAEYDGGELVMVNGDLETRLRCEAGDLLLYPTIMLHRVTPVTRGSRWAAVSWLESHVSDPMARQILADLAVTRAYFDRVAPNDPAAHHLRNGVYNLVRMWWRT